jgi:hypothetical protein
MSSKTVDVGARFFHHYLQKKPTFSSIFKVNSLSWKNNFNKRPSIYWVGKITSQKIIGLTIFEKRT